MDLANICKDHYMFKFVLKSVYGSYEKEFQVYSYKLKWKKAIELANITNGEYS
jgi:hypothetical protein